MSEVLQAVLALLAYVAVIALLALAALLCIAADMERIEATDLSRGTGHPFDLL